MQYQRRTLAKAVLAAFALGTLASTAVAQGSWPDKPVKIVVAFTPGGPTDVVARMIAEKLTTRWGQQVIVENKPGAAGVIGSEYVARSPADGYTLLMATAGNLTVNQHLYKNMKFDPVKDFAPIAQTAGVDFVLVTQPNAPFHNVKELIAAAKAKPGTITSATSGNGGAPHLAAALFENEAGVDLNLVPYKGTADAVNAVLGGQTQLDFDAASQVVPQIKGGKLKPLAVLGTKRSPLLPDVPTMAEAGLTKYNFSNWFGLVGPAHMPKEVIDKLQKDVAEVLKDPALRSRYEMLGLQAPAATTPAQFASVIQQDSAKWAATIQQAHIAAQ
ncbi:tripartite tricarboxylate transporter substrate binding protein [Ramlibacter ginsenosidimutans]|uniref:Tripartite tricarboxylate transporter substrate binding protein n=1 Tax=Ramlibacter ginsenosidimutans TaxID=502333 RepID=A0A934TUD2_9BURK|nr:tripartite tricarboxylate transporter substrate binding protein [Ramlibacter ginsenosidimutans]MBK6007045.1 tripartite tricarboxylate transporter substrate binding protein [Ramlibacter ginsenosidimutans]